MSSAPPRGVFLYQEFKHVVHSVTFVILCLLRKDQEREASPTGWPPRARKHFPHIINVFVPRGALHDCHQKLPSNKN